MIEERHEMDAEVKLPVEEIQALSEQDYPADAEDTPEDDGEEIPETEPEDSVEDAGEPQSEEGEEQEEAEAQGPEPANVTEEAEPEVEPEPEQGDVVDELEDQLKGVYEKLEAEGFDPDLTAAFKSVGEIAKSALKRAEAAEAAVVGNQQAAQHEQTMNWFDNKVSAMGGDFQDMFGKGTYKDISHDSDTFKNRAALFDDMANLMAGAEKTGKSLTMEAAFEKAFKAMTYDVAQQKHKEKLTNKVKHRDSQTMEPPGNKGSNVELDDDAEALSDLKSVLARMND